MLDVVVHGNKILQRPCAPVTVFDDNLKRLAAEMAATMIRARGLGIAAPQVGRPIRLAVIDDPWDDKKAIVLVNPEIYWSSDTTEDYEEGCLSLPGISLTVNRPTSISVKAQNVDGQEVNLKEVVGMLARSIQHEVDHLDGKTILDHVSPLQRSLLASKLKKMAGMVGRVRED